MGILDNVIDLFERVERDPGAGSEAAEPLRHSYFALDRAVRTAETLITPLLTEVESATVVEAPIVQLQIPDHQPTPAIASVPGDPEQAAQLASAYEALNHANQLSMNNPLLHSNDDQRSSDEHDYPKAA